MDLAYWSNLNTKSFTVSIKMTSPSLKFLRVGCLWLVDVVWRQVAWGGMKCEMHGPVTQLDNSHLSEISDYIITQLETAFFLTSQMKESLSFTNLQESPTTSHESRVRQFLWRNSKNIYGVYTPTTVCYSLTSTMLSVRRLISHGKLVWRGRTCAKTVTSALLRTTTAE